ncbi:binding-protein-dependent transport system inner membrane protein [Caballeronia sordidicola]|uniref:Binding-protein-dependent transport system inner membrane protein n=1 Tax=Caballeronia sordidicola TaxID=196367 RepID=A0A158FFJ8_CABSO|nr:ABC transporter permease [Caballeronia sordidicola]SAL18706.1 binding-protein-dependent transport system inner membrane protein [Caballeronia sordidicola]
MDTVRNRLPYWLTTPASLLMLAFVAIPLVLTLSQSLFQTPPTDSTGMTLYQYTQVFGDQYYRGIFTRTFELSVVVTFLCILIGVPEAYVLSRLSPRWRALSMFVVLGPLLMSVVVRTLGWAVLLGNEGLFNSLLLKLGLVDAPVRMMFTFSGVVVALVHVQVPFMVLAVWTSLQKMDVSTESAAETLGASSLTVLRRVVVPQVIPGVLSGGLVVFALTASAFATPAIIGGRRLKVVPTTIYDEILSNLNWPLGAAIAVVLMAAVLLISVGVGRYIERRYRQVF